MVFATKYVLLCSENIYSLLLSLSFKRTNIQYGNTLAQKRVVCAALMN